MLKSTHTKGRSNTLQTLSFPGVYCTGWVGTGPVGVINDTMMNSFDTGKVILHDLQSGHIAGKDLEKRNTLVNRLSRKGEIYVSWILNLVNGASADYWFLSLNVSKTHGR